MSDLIGRIMKEVKVERDAAEQGAGAIFSVIKERVGLRTFQMLRVPFPDAEVWIIFGDGACGYGLVEFDTFVRHGIPVIAIVGNDAGWTQIAREQVKMLHDDVATVLARTDYHKVATGFGAEGILVREMAEVQPALARARALARSGKPVLVNIWLDKTEFREGSLSM